MALQSRRCWLRAILLTLPLLCTDVVASAATPQQHTVPHAYCSADPTAAFLPRKSSIISSFSRPALWTAYHHRDQSRLSAAQRIATSSRGGSSVGEEDADSDDERQYDEYDQYDDEEEGESADDSIVDTDGVQIEVKVEKFDEPLVASPLANLYATLAIFLLSRRIDLFHPTVVKIARFAFVAYLAVLQLFLLYVRIQAKLNNDRTPIELKNPLSSVVQSQLGGDGDENSMMKNLASSLLSFKSTVLEYDLKQARSMQSGLIASMLLMWFLHFKMEKVQPLLIQTLNGLTSMVYSPLFQVYVLGRNLERPFQNPALKRMQEAEAALREEQLAGEDDAETAAETVDDDDDEDEEEEEEEEDESEAEAAVDDEDESESEEGSKADEDEEAEAESEKEEGDDEEDAGSDNEEGSEVKADDNDEAEEKPDSASTAEENDADESKAEDKPSADESAET